MESRFDDTERLLGANDEDGLVPLPRTGSSSYICATLTSSKVKASTLYAGASLALIAAYYGFIYASIKFFSQDNPSLVDYRNTHTNGTTCEKVLPMKGNVCNFLDANNIPDLAPLGLYCAHLLDEQVIRMSLPDYFNAFLINNCTEFLPEINLANVTGMSAAVLQCMSYASEYYRYRLGFLEYLNATSVLNGATVLCNTIFPFANADAYNAFCYGRGALCWDYAFTISYFYSTFSAAYHAAVGAAGACAASFPLNTFNFSLGMQNLYNVVPYLGPCYKEASSNHPCYDSYQTDSWMSFGRFGLIVVGLGAAALLFALTYLLIRNISHIFHEDSMRKRNAIELSSSSNTLEQGVAGENTSQEITKRQCNWLPSIFRRENKLIVADAQAMRPALS